MTGYGAMETGLHSFSASELFGVSGQLRAAPD
jgi:hypothetical protein